MEDKVFDLLEKLYIDMQDMKTEMQGVKTEMQGVKTDIKGIKTDMQGMKTEMRQGFAQLEHKMDENHKALYDGYKQSIEGIAQIRGRLDKFTDKVENHEIRLQVLESTK